MAKGIGFKREEALPEGKAKAERVVKEGAKDSTY